jgi:hypothetical protein
VNSITSINENHFKRKGRQPQPREYRHTPETLPAIRENPCALAMIWQQYDHYQINPGDVVVIRSASEGTITRG